MAADWLDTGQDFLPDVRYKDMLQLLEKIPFSDPSALTSTYQTFGKQVYDVLHKCDVDRYVLKTLDSRPTRGKGHSERPLPSGRDLTSSAEGYHGQRDMELMKNLPEYICRQDDVMMDKEQSARVASRISTPDGMRDHKFDETESVDSSEAICETLVPCIAPAAEKVPQVEESPKDRHWSNFKENIPEDSPSQNGPLKCLSHGAFVDDFKSILYSSCEDYQKWIAEAVDLMQTAGKLKKKHQALAEMRSTDFPTPLKDAECVSLVMAYELYSTNQSKENLAASLEWIACQLDSDNSERKPACLFACLTLLGGICFFAKSQCFANTELGPKEMVVLLRQAISFDELPVVQMVLNWQQDVVYYQDANGWAPLHLAAKRNAPTMIHILCEKSAQKEETTHSGNTPLLVAALADAEASIKILLAKEANPNAANVNWWTPVHYMAAADNEQMIELLHQHGGELDAITWRKNSPLSLAVMTNSERTVALLMHKCSTLGNWKNSSNWTAVHLAASKNAPKMLQILTGFAEVDFNAVTDKGNTPLAIAVLQSCLQAVEVLLVANANPDVPNKEGWSTLHIAAQQNECHMIYRLCEAGADTETPTLQGNTPLCIAAMNGCSDAAAELLKQKANPNARNESGWSAVHYAAAANASKMARHITQADNVNLTLKTYEENTALLIAVTHGAKDAAKVLVDAGADANVKGPEEWTALHFAVYQDDQEFIEILCNARADIDAKCSECKTPLMLAVMQNSVQSVQSVLDKHANPNLIDVHGWAALHMAAVSNEFEAVEILQLLIHNGASVDGLTNKGNTALSLAVLYDLIKTAEVLLLGKADPSMCGDHLWSPLHIAADKNYAKMAELLCRFGANVNSTNHQGYTPLVISVAKGSNGVARTLLKNNASPNIQSELNGWSALHFAAQEDNHAVSEMLCCSADLNVRTHEGNTPLLIAAMKQSKRMVSTLLRRKADVNVCDSNGWTALHCVAQVNAAEIIPILCACSADCEAKTAKGNTPLAIAVIHNADLATQVLIDHGADVNARNCDDWTPLCCAIHKESFGLELIESLCSPANVSLQTKQHGNPLHLCHKKSYERCLLEQGAQLSVLTLTPEPVSVRAELPVLHSEVLFRPYVEERLSNKAESIILDVADNCPPVAVFNVAAAEPVLVTEQLAVQHCDKVDGLNVEESHSSTLQSTTIFDMDEGKGNTPLHTAAYSGHKELVEGILEKNADLANVPGENGYLPIQFAAMGNQPAVIELLSHHCNAQDIMDQNGYNLLHLAAIYNCTHAVKYLLCKGHCPDAKDHNGYCPIHVASLVGSTAVIGVFLQHDMSMLSLLGRNGYTLLHCAARRGQAKVVEFICSNYPGAIDINAVTSLGETPLHVASMFKTGNAEVIKALCKFGANVAMRDDTEDNALHFAVLRGDEEKAKALLSANPNVVDMAGASGETPLHWAVKKIGARKSSENLITEEELKMHDILADGSNASGEAPVHQPVKSAGSQKFSDNPVTSEESKMIDILCDASDNVNPGDQYGNTPLHFAAAYARDEVIVKQLLAKGAEPEKRNCEGLTPLDFAASRDARNCFIDMYSKAQEAYNIDKVFYDMHRAHEYITYHQMDKAGKLMCRSISDAQYWKFLKDDDENARDKVSLIFIMKQDVDDISCQPPFKAVLDKCIYGKKVIRRPALFEADSEGNLPGSRNYNIEDGSFLSNLVKKPKLLFALADHPALQAYVSYRWGQIASPLFWRGLLFYILQLFLLTFALASAARPDLPLNGGYRDPIDIFRGICEAAILLITVVRIGIEVFEFLSNWKAYLLDWLNYVQWCFIVLILAVVPLRATAHPGQWIVAALAYFVFGLQAFEFLIISSYIGVYVQTLIIIFWRDIFKFLGMFTVVLVVLSGPLYLSLRYDADLANSTTAALLSGEGSSLHETYFSGLRIMIEAGSILDYYDRSGSVFGPLTIILYLLFLFLVVIILLNVLIAQVSGTYTAVQSTARATFLFHRSRFITRCEESTALWFLLWTFRWKKIGSSYRLRCDVESQTYANQRRPKGCKCLQRKVVREVFYCDDDDDAMYWPGQLFHKKKDGNYLDSSLRARFGRSMESAGKFIEDYFYPRIVSAYEETAEADDVGVVEDDDMPASIKEAFEAQTAAMKDLQAQMKMIAERQNRNMKWLQAQMEKIAMRQNGASLVDGGSEDSLQQELDRQIQQICPSSSQDI